MSRVVSPSEVPESQHPRNVDTFYLGCLSRSPRLNAIREEFLRETSEYSRGVVIAFLKPQKPQFVAKLHGETAGKYKLRQEIFVNWAVTLHVWDHSKSPGERRAKTRKTSGQEVEIDIPGLREIHADLKICLEVSVSRSIFFRGVSFLFPLIVQWGFSLPKRSEKFPGGSGR